MRELIIRRAAEDDAEKIIEYLNIIGGESDNLLFGENGIKIPVEREKNLIRETNSSNKSILIVGLIDEEIVSVATLQGYERDRISHRGSIAISVKKKYWNKGIATKMIKEIINFAKGAKINVIQLEVKTDNKSAIALYEKMGFKKIGVYKNFFKIEGKYYDADLMNLYM